MTILDKNKIDFISTRVQQTELFGEHLGRLLEKDDVLCLYGEMGAGKTTLSRGIGRGWGTTMRITSPTYTLVNQYPREKDDLILYHLDFYRLQSENEVITTGIEDLVEYDGAMMIEWPQLVKQFLPNDLLNVHLTLLGDAKRNILLEATGGRSRELLEQFRKNAFGK